MRDRWTPSHQEPEISISATEGGFKVTVGYSIDQYWYPCRSRWARSERRARKVSKQLLRWYRAYVARSDAAERLGAEIGGSG